MLSLKGNTPTYNGHFQDLEDTADQWSHWTTSNDTSVTLYHFFSFGNHQNREIPISYIICICLSVYVSVYLFISLRFIYYCKALFCTPREMCRISSVRICFMRRSSACVNVFAPIYQYMFRFDLFCCTYRTKEFMLMYV